MQDVTTLLFDLDGFRVVSVRQPNSGSAGAGRTVVVGGRVRAGVAGLWGGCPGGAEPLGG